MVFVWNVPHTHSRTTTAFACIFQCFFCQQVQQSCNSSSASPEPTEEQHESEMVKMTKSKTFQAYLPNCHRTYSCIHCRAHLANHDELISKVSKTNTGTHILARIQANTHTHMRAHVCTPERPFPDSFLKRYVPFHIYLQSCSWFW